MPQSLKFYIAGVVTLSAVALVVATFVFPAETRIALYLVARIRHRRRPSQLEILGGIAFWIVLTLLASALPVRLPVDRIRPLRWPQSSQRCRLGGPAVAGWVAAIGTTEVRELRGRIPWYGIPGEPCGRHAAGDRRRGRPIRTSEGASSPGGIELAVESSSRRMAGATVLFGLNIGDRRRAPGPSDGAIFQRRHCRATRERPLQQSRLLRRWGGLWPSSTRSQWWAALLFALPLYTTRHGSQRFVEMRDMFTQTIGALAEAVDKRDPYTARHSQNVKAIAVDIGRVMRVNDAELEALEWGGLLHDVGKIGVPDAVLLKPDRLNREERMHHELAPGPGRPDHRPGRRSWRAELPIIRHHHEWYNGSGYPDRLIGDEIPKLARILHVADAFEAMTAARPYRMTPLTNEQALAELRKFAGVQFDPVVVDAFVRTPHVRRASRTRAGRRARARSR